MTAFPDQGWSQWPTSNIKSSFDPCSEPPQRGSDEIGSLTIGNAFAGAALERYSRFNDMRLRRFPQTAWAIILAEYLATDAVTAAFFDCQSLHSSVFCCASIDQSLSIKSLLDRLTVRNTDFGDNESELNFNALCSISISTHLFDTVLILDDQEQQPYDGTPTNSAPWTILLSVNLRLSSITISYSKTYLSKPIASSIASAYASLLNQGQNFNSVPIKQLDIVGSLEKAQLIAANHIDFELRQSTIHEEVAAVAQSLPNNEAVCAWDGSMSYSQLLSTSGKLARHLRLLGVTRGTTVPFHFHHSKWSVIAMLATMQAGGAPVALNPDFPKERLMHIISKTHADIILAGRDLETALDQDELETVVVDEVTVQSMPDVTLPLKERAQPGDAGFVLFTSGSTGQPKGIIIEHKNFLAGAAGQQRAAGITEDSRVFQFGAYSFDAVLLETFTTLLAGGCVCVPSEADRTSDIVGSINTLQVNWAGVTPSLATVLRPEEVPTLRTLAFWGEPSTHQLLDLWANNVMLLNIFGPAECSVVISRNEFSSNTPRGRIPANIGRPLHTVNAWVVRPSNYRHLSPVGAVGELLVQGPTVSRGYLNDQPKTTAAYVSDLPFLPESCEPSLNRAYRTGDLVRYAADGSLRYLGRADSQVKLHGQRMELGEIEHHLQTLLSPGSKVAADVLSPSDQPSQKMLVAFYCLPEEDAKPADKNDNTLQTHVVPRSEIICNHHQELKYQLMQSLPPFMVPSCLVPLHVMPTSPSGKADRKALRQIGSSLSASDLGAYLPADAVKRDVETGMERELQMLWADTLSLDSDSIKRDDHFLWLGGNSISAMRMSIAAKKLQLQLSVAAIMQNPKLCNMAASIKHTPADVEHPPSYTPFSLVCTSDHEKTSLLDWLSDTLNVTTLELEDAAPATDYQTEVATWAFLKARGGLNFVTFDFGTPLEEANLHAACTRLVAHHAILRTVFLPFGKSMLQVVLQMVRANVQSFDSKLDIEAETQRLIADDSLDKVRPGTLFTKFFMLKTSAGVHRLIMRASHAQYEGVALSHICSDLSPAYFDLPLMARPSFLDYRAYVIRNVDVSARNFWKTIMQGSQPFKIFDRQDRPYYKNRVDGAVARKYKSESIRSHPSITLASTIKTAWSIILWEMSGKSDVNFASVVWGRNTPFDDIENVVGPCINRIPIRAHLGSDTQVHDLLDRIQHDYVAAIPYETYGTNAILDQCTDWPTWERLSTLVLVQNMDVSFGRVDIGDQGNYASVGEIRRPVDRADIALYIQPDDGGETLMSINFCTDLFPREFIEQLLDRLCFLCQSLRDYIESPIGLIPLDHKSEYEFPLGKFNLRNSKYEDSAGLNENSNGHSFANLNNNNFSGPISSDINGHEPRSSAYSSDEKTKPMDGVQLEWIASNGVTADKKQATMAETELVVDYEQRRADSDLEQKVKKAWQRAFNVTSSRVDEVSEADAAWFDSLWGHPLGACVLSAELESMALQVDPETLIDEGTFKGQLDLLRK